MSPMAHEYADKLPHRIAVQFENHCMHMPAADGQQQPQQQQSPHLNGISSPPAAASGIPAGAELNAAQQQQQQHHHHHHHQQQQQQQQQVGQPPVQRRASQSLDAAPAQQLQLDPVQQAAAAGADPAAEDTAAAFAGSASLVPAPLSAVPDAENSVSSLSSSEGGSVEKLHFFGVYDGHGGIEASQHCAQRLHYHLSKAVAELANGWLESSAGDEAAGSWNPEVRYVPLDTARVGDSGSPGECQLAATAAAEDSEGAAAAAPSSSGGAAQSLSSSSSSSGSSGDDRELGRSVSQASSGNSGNSSPGSSGDCEVDSNEGSAEGSEGTATSFCGLMEEVLRDAFLKTDEEFSNSGLQAGLVGSTAVVALVGTHRVWIANCGDSRAVLSRAGVAIQVTDDHKPEREDEAERVEKAGGQVLYWNGHRVMGVLAMSRAIGDHCLRPYVIPEPEISVFARHPRDEILLLASDGLWDVLSNQDATDLALRSIKRAREKGASRKAAARVAATVLTKAAVDRGSRDNITVVIIDLAPTPAGGEQQRQCNDKAAMAAAANGPPSPDSLEPQQPARAEGDAAAAATAGGGSGSRPSTSGSSKGAGRTGSLKGCGSGSNPFAAAAASPFSTAATGSSELPLPSGASGSGNAPGNEALAAVGSTAAAGATQTAERSGRSAAGSGRLRGPSGTGCASGGSSSVFAAATVSASASIGSSSTEGSVQQQREAQQQVQQQGSDALLSEQLDSIDLSGMGAAAGRGGSSLPSIDSMAKASSAAEGSTTSSSLEEQPTIVEPPPSLVRQTSSSPFSAFQGNAPFSDGGAEAVC